MESYVVTLFRHHTTSGVEVSGIIERLEGGGRTEFRDAEMLVAWLKSDIPAALPPPEPLRSS